MRELEGKGTEGVRGRGRTIQISPSVTGASPLRLSSLNTWGLKSNHLETLSVLLSTQRFRADKGSAGQFKESGSETLPPVPENITTGTLTLSIPADFFWGLFFCWFIFTAK